MRYWLWYKADGEIGGEAIISGGWSDDFDFNDPDTLDETALTIRNQLIAAEGFHSFISYDCPCDPSVEWCHCSTHRCADSRIEGSELATKPDFDILLDDIETDNLSVTDVSPGMPVSLKLSGNIPDGVVVQVHNLKPVDLLQTSPADLVFAGGETNSVSLISPSQGMKGGVGIVPLNRKDAQMKHIKIRGWA